MVGRPSIGDHTPPPPLPPNTLIHKHNTCLHAQSYTAYLHPAYLGAMLGVVRSGLAQQEQFQFHEVSKTAVS